MTLAASGVSVTYTGNDSTTEWSFSFRVDDADHLVVKVLDTTDESVTTISSALYSVDGIGAAAGGTVTYPLSGSPLTTTDRIILERSLPLTQDLDITTAGGFDPEVVEDQLDWLVMQIQQVDASFGRALTLPVGDDFSGLELPIDSNRAGKYLYFAADGDLSLTGTAPSVQYQGAFASASEPTVRLGGGALQEGDLYFNTDAGRLKVYTGSSWQTGVDSTGIDINGLTTIDAVAGADELALYDVTATANRKATVQELMDAVSILTALGAAADTADSLLLYDSDASAAKKVTVANLLAAATTTQGQHTIWVPAAAMVPNTTNGAASGTAETTTNKVMLQTLDFDQTTSESAQFGIQMPKSWDEGTIVAQVVWSHASAATYGVVWGIQAVAFADGDALDTAFGTTQEVTDTGGTTDDVYITDETSAMTVAGTPGAEEYIMFKVYRDPTDASDTLDTDARLHGVKLHYTTDADTDD